RQKRRASANALDQRAVVQSGFLASHRVRYGTRQAAGSLPLFRRANMAVAANLIDAPVNLEPVIVGIAEFDGDLTTGATPPREVDFYTTGAQMFVSQQDLVERCDFEGDMVEVGIRRRSL